MNIVDKLSSYNFFNYLLPGITFVVLGAALTIHVPTLVTP